MPRVLIADPDSSSSNAIYLWLVHRMGIEDIAQVSSGEYLLARLREGKTDVVLMDWSLPDRPAAESFHELREIRPDLILVVLSEKAEAATEAEAYRATFIHKSIPPADFMAALQPLFKGFSDS